MLGFLGCQNNNTASGAGKIHWDRDMCARCVMVVSDRQNTVQLKNPTTKKNHVFDDIGCMAVWFDENKIAFKDTVKVWVNDASNGDFIDARTAFYTTENITPMSFGFSAYKVKQNIETGLEVIGYEEVMKRALVINRAQ